MSYDFRLLCLAGCTLILGTSGCTRDSPQPIKEVSSVAPQSESPLDSPDLATRLRSLEAQLDNVRQKLDQVLNALRDSGYVVDGQTDDSEEVQFQTLGEAKALVAELGTRPGAKAFADVLAEIDSWLVRPDEETPLMTMKETWLSQLRKLVEEDVIALQDQALTSASGKDGARLHAQAGQILILFPMTEDASVLDKARQLSSRQAEVAARLAVIQRQRYNRWAVDKIEAALRGYNEKGSYWSPTKENVLLVNSLVDSLGPVDPSLLEPAVLELYQYVIDITKKSISEADRVDLAKRMTAPTITRKGLGDF